MSLRPLYSPRLENITETLNEMLLEVDAAKTGMAYHWIIDFKSAHYSERRVVENLGDLGKQAKRIVDACVNAGPFDSADMKIYATQEE